MHFARRVAMKSTRLARRSCCGGADPNAIVASGWNALHVATWCGYKQIVAMLLSRGAVIEARSRKSGETALLFAAFFGHLEVCLLLIAKEPTCA